MQTMVFAEELRNDGHEGDVDRIVRVLAERNVRVSRTDARKAWEAHSDGFSASWMMLDGDSDDYIADQVMRHLTDD